MSLPDRPTIVMTPTTPPTPTAAGTLRPGLQALPFAAVFVVFFLIPLGLVAMVSFWDFNEYALLPT
ncbi:hypothetical protein ABTK00_22470, partial [Acinetobacter baumannii]